MIREARGVLLSRPPMCSMVGPARCSQDGRLPCHECFRLKLQSPGMLTSCFPEVRPCLCLPGKWKARPSRRSQKMKARPNRRSQKTLLSLCSHQMDQLIELRSIDTAPFSSIMACVRGHCSGPDFHQQTLVTIYVSVERSVGSRQIQRVDI